MAVDQAKLNELLGRFVNDFGATGFAATVVIGDNLGLYVALAAGPATPAELAELLPAAWGAWDRDSEQWFAFVLLACALVCFNRLSGGTSSAAHPFACGA